VKDGCALAVNDELVFETSASQTVNSSSLVEAAARRIDPLKPRSSAY
jgi:hypothetical protein